MNKKGIMIELLAIILCSFIIILFFAGWMYGSDLINTNLLGIETGDSSANVSYATSQTLSYVNTGLDELQMIAAIIIFGYIIATFIIGYFSAKHPIWFVVYIITIALFYILSVYVSNQYVDLLSNEVLGPTLTGFSLGTYLMKNLDTFVLVIGGFGIIFSLIGRYLARESFG